ncbi:MAG: AbrB/MazE/SpoVT family DNA-binding domain-containing protein [Lentisphaerae bacterium]|nr:AbrB/MazE/SpoVT family DNA-binding domain-containing protein [Lentisphaerota bacterium]
MQTTLTEKGQITIPVRIRRRLGLVAGQKLEFDESAGFIKAVKAVSRKEMESVRGCLKDKLDEPVDRYLEQTRGKVALPSKRT